MSPARSATVPAPAPVRSSTTVAPPARSKTVPAPARSATAPPEEKAPPPTKEKTRKKQKRPEGEPGACFCGGVQFTVTSKPAQVLVDQSAISQRSSGTFEIPFAAFDKSKIVWHESETLKTYSPVEGQTRSFCGTCGALVCAEYVWEERTTWLALGLLAGFKVPARSLPCSRIASEQKHPAADGCRTLPERYDLGTYYSDPCSHALFRVL